MLFGPWLCATNTPVCAAVQVGRSAVSSAEISQTCPVRSQNHQPCQSLGGKSVVYLLSEVWWISGGNFFMRSHELGCVRFNCGSPSSLMNFNTASTIVWYQSKIQWHIPTAARAASPLPPQSAGLNRKSKIALGKIFLLSTCLFYLTFAGLGGRICDVRVRAGTSGDASALIVPFTADVAFEGLSNGVAFKGRKSCILRRMKPLRSRACICLFL